MDQTIEVDVHEGAGHNPGKEPEIEGIAEETSGSGAPSDRSQ